MIVRIATEEQYRMPSSALDELNEMDNKLVEVTARGDAAEFQRILSEMLQYVRTNGKPLMSDELVESDVILPPPDTSLDEARNLFVGEGMIPG
ncbi:MAG: hypothetical protein EXR50_00225 [Dehalococcoidia bacterium]|nr:hypothetical protein [Dehalococcoidia bacterium]